MEFNENETYYYLDYHHEEIEFLLDKINNGYVLTKDEYDKLKKLNVGGGVSSFSGDYNDLINKPDIVEEIKRSLTVLEIETSNSVNKKLESLQDNIETTIQQTVSGKADIIHKHNISNVNNLQSALDSKAELLHDHNDKYPTIEYVEERFEEIKSNTDIDLSDYVTKDFMNEALNNKANKSHIHNINDVTDLKDALDNKPDWDSVYDKTSVDILIETHTHDEHYTKEEINKNFVSIEDHLETIEEFEAALATKADLNHEHNEYAKQEHEHVTEDIIDIRDNFYDISTVDELLTGKANIDHNHNDIYYTKDEVEEEIDNKLEPYAKKEYVDQELAGKSDIDHNHDDMYASLEHEHMVEDVTDLFNHVYNKDETDEFLAGKSNIDHKHEEYAPLEHEHTIEDVTDLLDNIYTETEVDEFLAGKSNIDHTHDEYAPLEHEHDVNDVTDLFEHVYDKDEMDASLAEKADVNHEHKEYALVDHKHNVEDIENLGDTFYDKDEIDSFLSEKADVNHVHEEYAALEHEHLTKDITDLYDNIYDKDEVDEFIASKADMQHSHTITDITNLQDELDSKIDKDVAATKEELETGLLGKADINHSHGDEYAALEHEHNDLYYTEDEIGELLEKAKDDTRIAAVTEANQYTAIEITKLVDSAPEAMNTLNELANAIKTHEDVYEAYVETVSEALAGKSNIDHNHDAIYYTKGEIDERLDKDITSSLAEYAKIKYVDDALATKADSIHKHDTSEINGLDETLNIKINKDIAALKEELNEALAGKASNDHNHNDIYYTRDEIDSNISDKIGAIDFSSFATKEELATKAPAEHIHDMSVIPELEEELNKKANKEDSLTKTEITDLLSSKSDTTHKHEGVYLTEGEIRELVGDSIASADLEKYATKDYVDVGLATRAEAGHGHDASEIEGLEEALKDKMDVSVGATKEELAGKADDKHTHDISEIDNLQEELDKRSADTYTKDEVDILLVSKLDANLINIITNEQIDNIMSETFNTDI
jgi:hypothetical protein